MEVARAASFRPLLSVVRGTFALALCAAVVLVPGTARGQSEPVWEPAEEITSTSTQTFGRATSISCVTDDDCVMVGFLGFNPSIAVATERVDGAWGDLIENPGLSQVVVPDWDPAASVSLGQVSCLDSGECVAGGSLGLASGGSTGFVATRTAGTWSAETIPGLVELSTDTGATPNAGVNSVSCDATGLCVAGGVYRYGAANNLFGGWVSTRTDGTWSTAVPVPGLPALNVRDNAQVSKVTCPGGGCVVIGTYMADVDGNARGQAFIAEFAGGTWDDAFPVPGLIPPDGVNQGAASFEGLGCATFDDCAAGGRYWNGTAFQGFVVDKTAGTWGSVTDVPGLAPAANVAVQHIDCPAAGECAMTAQNFTTNVGYLVSQSGGVWQDAEQLVFADGLDGVINAMRGISCSAPGECAAVGIYRTSTFSTFQAWQATLTDGVWSEANSVPGMGELLTDPPSRSHGEAVDCVADAGCNFGGVTFFGGPPHRLFAAARVGGGATPAPSPEFAPESSPESAPIAVTWVPTPANEAPRKAPAAAEAQREGGQPVVLTAATTGAGELTYADAEGSVSIVLTGDTTTSVERGVVATREGMVRCEVCAALDAGTVVEVWSFSTPRLVAAAAVDERGCIDTMIPLRTPLDGGDAIPAGAHTLQVILPMNDGGGRLAVNVGVTVDPTVPTRVSAGEGPAVPGRFDMLPLLVAAAGAVAVARRRRATG